MVIITGLGLLIKNTLWIGYVCGKQSIEAASEPCWWDKLAQISFSDNFRQDWYGCVIIWKYWVIFYKFLVTITNPS